MKWCGGTQRKLTFLVDAVVCRYHSSSKAGHCRAQGGSAADEGKLLARWMHAACTVPSLAQDYQPGIQAGRDSLLLCLGGPNICSHSAPRSTSADFCPNLFSPSSKRNDRHRPEGTVKSRAGIRACTLVLAVK